MNNPENSSIAASRRYEFGEFWIDGMQGRLWRHDGSPVALAPRLVEALLFLVERPGTVHDRDTLMAAWWPGLVVEDSSLNQAVSALRRALGDDAQHSRYIQTVPRRGFRFVAEVRARASAAPAAEPSVAARVLVETPPVAPAPEPVDTPSVVPPPAESPRSRIMPARQRYGLPAGIAVLALVAIGAALWWSGRERSTEPAAAAPVASLAVLPFQPLLPGSSDPALELGLTDTLITQLSLIPGLRVSSLAAVRPFGDPVQDPVQAGRALGVDVVLEGSLQSDPQRLRIRARLVRVSDGQALWAGDFNEPLSGIFELHDAVARRVVDALAVRLSSEQEGRLARRATTSTAAYKHYANGLYLWQLRRPEAVEQFEAALREDPKYVLAWSGLANALASRGVYGYAPPAQVFPRARAAAQTAVDLAPDSAAARTALGQVLVQGERSYRDGEREYLAALRLDPDDATAWFRLAIVRAYMGRLDEAIEALGRARELEPVTLNHGANLAMFLYLKRDFGGARGELDRILALDAGFDHARAILGRVLLAQGDAAAAIGEFRRQAGPVPGGDGDLGRAYARAGRLSEAQAEISRLELRGAKGFGVGYDLAGVHAALGDLPRACDALRRALSDRSQLVGFLRHDPAMDPLRGQSCYAEVLREVEAAGR